MLQQQYGSVFITLHQEAGVVLLTPTFVGSRQDEQDWNKGVKWINAQGYRFLDGDEPYLAPGDGAEVYRLTKRA